MGSGWNPFCRIGTLGGEYVLVGLVAFDNGLNPFRNQYRLGPFNWIMDSSMRKTFQLTQKRGTLRVGIDVFNATVCSP